jgi:hypothetical protein
LCSKKCVDLTEKKKKEKKKLIFFVISTLKMPKPFTSQLEIITFNDTEEVIIYTTTYSLILILISCLDPDFVQFVQNLFQIEQFGHFFNSLTGHF